MVWLSTTTCTPSRPRRRLRPPLLRNMRLSLRWLPSMVKHENWERFLHWLAKKYMWSIHECDHNSLGHSKSKWALPIAILQSRRCPPCIYTHLGKIVPPLPTNIPPWFSPHPLVVHSPLFKAHGNECLLPPGAHELHSRGTL